MCSPVSAIVPLKFLLFTQLQSSRNFSASLLSSLSFCFVSRGAVAVVPCTLPARQEPCQPRDGSSRRRRRGRKARRTQKPTLERCWCLKSLGGHDTFGRCSLLGTAPPVCRISTTRRVRGFYLSRMYWPQPPDLLVAVDRSGRTTDCPGASISCTEVSGWFISSAQSCTP